MAKDLLQGDIGKHLRALSIPAATSYLFHTLYNVTDTFFAGSISTQSLAALSLSGPIFFVLLAVASGMSSAVSAVTANAIGKKDSAKSATIAWNTLLFGLLLSAVVTLIGLISASMLLGLLNASGELLVLALAYIHIIIVGSVLFIGSMFVNALLNAQGDMTSLRNILVVTFVLNIGLDYIALYVGWGIQGIGAATIATEFLALSYLTYKLHKSGLLRSGFSVDFSIWKRLFKQGIPPTANMFFMSIGTFIVVYYVSHFGEHAVAAYGVGIKIEQLVLMPILGLSVAVLTLVAQNNGAKQYARITQSVNSALWYAALLSLVALMVLWLFPEFLIALFSNDAAVILEGVRYLHVESLLVFPFAVIFIYISLLQGIEEPALIAYISAARQIILPIILLEIAMVFSDDLMAVWVSIAISVISAALFITLFARKKLRQVIACQEPTLKENL